MVGAVRKSGRCFGQGSVPAEGDPATFSPGQEPRYVSAEVPPRLPAGLFNGVLSLLLAWLFEDLKDLLDRASRFWGGRSLVWMVLLVRLEVAQVRLLGQVPVYETHDCVDLLARETVATAGYLPTCSHPFSGCS